VPSSSTTDHDVVIVGLGPTGATLAHLLALKGIKTLVLEREPAIYPLPRAVHFDDETMRVFQTVGIADALFKKIRINPGMRFVDADQTTLLDWPRPDNISAQGWHPSYRFHQPDLEYQLRKQLTSRADVIALLGCKVVDITRIRETPAQPGHCVISYIDAQQQAQQVTSRYVVGCDGANSMVRSAIGTDYTDLGFRERWLVVDVLLQTEKPELGDFTVQHCNPARPCTYVRCPENRRRWEFALHDSETDADMQNEKHIWSLLQPWLTSTEASIERSAVYTFRSTLAQTWYADHLCLAGDAAHLTPPFMGQGLCCGVRDAANLAWKLARCIKDGHSQELLQSYETERVPHMTHYLETAMKLGGLINTCATEEALRSILLNPDGTAKMKSISPRLGPGLSPALASAPDADGKAKSNAIVGAHLTAADQLDYKHLYCHAGSLFPQPILANQQRLDDVVGYNAVLLLPSDWLENLTLAGTDLTMITEKDSQGFAQLLSAWQSRAILIRPDRYVFGSANNERELEQLLSHFSHLNPANDQTTH